jgi:hypothetical protein
MDWRVVVVAGVCALAAVLLAYYRDQTRAKQRKDILAAPPDRQELSQWQPTYLSEDEVRTGARHQDRSHGREDVSLDQLKLAKKLPGGWASEDFITHDSRRAIADSPLVIITERMMDFRLLIPILELVHNQDSALVVVAREFSEEVVTTLGLNALTGKLSGLCVRTDETELYAETVGCSVALEEYLQAGWLPETVQGSCEMWVSDHSSSWIW